MMAQGAQLIHGDFINAAYQGYYDRGMLKEEQVLEGTGVVLDDEFNFMLSRWRGTMLNGDSFVRTADGQMLYGWFQQNSPVGMMAVQREGLKMFISRAGLKSRAVQWHKEVAAIDTNTNVFYILELNKKDDQETTIDPKTSNSESSRYDRVRIQWKIKILERCPLKADGTPAANSKLMKRYDRKIQLKKGVFTVREQNEISMLASALGNVFQKPALITPLAFLENMAKEDKKISLSRLKESNEEEETLLVSLDGKYSKQDKKLGMSFSLSYDYVKSIGSYSQSNRLNGLGVQYRKNGESLVGLFKQGLLSKQYKFNHQGSRNVSTFPIRQLASQQHLKSLNYVHNCIYLPQIGNITAITAKIARYIQAFQREYQKRNPNYNDTPSCQSISEEGMNIYKYVDMAREKHQFLAVSRPLYSDYSDREFKKPGFILNKSNNKSFEKSPPPKQPSPSLSPSKSPLKPVRITGKIYRQASQPSPSRSASKSGQIQTYKRRY